MTSDLENTTCEGRLKELGTQTEGKEDFKSQEDFFMPLNMYNIALQRK